jgi:hypothetical protein
MGIRYADLDQATRGFMRAEIAAGGHYLSPRLTVQGKADWPRLLGDAATGHDDDWLAGELLSARYLLDEEPYTRSGITRYRRVNQQQAAQQLAEGEFNRYYLRALCQRAASEGMNFLIVYRGKEVRSPRPESEARVGTSVQVAELLPALRQNDFVTIEDAIGVPGGPNSGLTCRLPARERAARM